MRAVICTKFGPPEELEVQELPSPEPKKGEVRIKVAGCGVNFPDTLIIEGKYQLRAEPPFSPGGEVAGEIDAVGEGVEGWAKGDKVIAMTGYGGFAEEIVAPAKSLLRRPDTMDAVTAAGFTMTYGTSMHALKQRARLQPGETLLVLGAGGGVGLAAVEIGKVMGARVIAAASSQAKLEAAREAGADELLDYSDGEIKDKLKKMTGGNGVDVTYDPVGGPMFEQALRATAWKGRVLVVGFASGEIPKVPMNLALLKGCEIVGVFWGAFRMREPQEDQANFDQLFKWHAEGRLKPHVSRTMPLEEAPEALRALANREAIGKIVLTA